MCPDYGTDQEKLWKKLVEFQAYNDRVLELLARLGNHIKIIFRYVEGRYINFYNSEDISLWTLELDTINTTVSI